MEEAREKKIVDFPSSTASDDPLNTPYSESDEESKEEIEALKKALEDTQNELLLAKEKLLQKDEEAARIYKESQKDKKYAETVFQELAHYKNSVQIQLEQNAQVMTNSQQTIAEQRSLVEKKHQHIAQLETKVRDLTYEIKTLLQLAEIANQPSFDPIEQHDYPAEPSEQLEFNLIPATDPDKDAKSLENAAAQLKRCIDIAQKITGGSHYRIGSPRFRELAGDNYTLDLRRLFDGLRQFENSGLILFYSQKENKILFVSNQVRNFLGWGSDKFLQNFYQIIDPSIESWKSGLSQLAFKNQAKIELSMKNRSGQDVSMHGMLGIVPTGIFRNHILGIFVPKSSSPANQ